MNKNSSGNPGVAGKPPFESAAAAPPSKRSRRFRVDVGTIVSAVALTQSLLLVSLGYWGSQRLVSRIGTSAHKANHDRTEDKVLAFLQKAESVIDAAGSAPSLRPAGEQSERTSELLWTLLAQSPELDSIYVANEAGQMLMALRYPTPAMRHIERGPQFTTPEVNRHDFALAKDLDLRVTVHVGDGYWGKSGPIHKLKDDGLLADTTTYVHCDTLADDELQLIADSGGSASVSPDVEMQMGHGTPATGRLLKHGIRPTFSIDVCSSNGGDMFGTMRTAIGMQRWVDNEPAVETGEVIERIGLTCAEVVRFATIDGANAAGLGDVTGSIVVGKAADIIALDDRSLSITPMNNPFGAVVYAAHPGLVRDVFVAGKRVKKDGQLVGVDYDKVKALALAARDHVMGEMPGASLGGGWHPDL